MHSFSPAKWYCDDARGLDPFVHWKRMLNIGARIAEGRRSRTLASCTLIKLLPNMSDYTGKIRKNRECRGCLAVVDRTESPSRVIKHIPEQTRSIASTLGSIAGVYPERPIKCCLRANLHSRVWTCESFGCFN